MGSRLVATRVNGNGGAQIHNWIVGIGIVLSLLFQVINYVSPRDDLRLFRSDVDGKFISIEKNYVPEREFQTTQALRDAVEVERKFWLIRDLDRTYDRMNTILARQVPREEHQEHWNVDESKFSDLNKAIDSIRSLFTGSFNLGDDLKELHKRLDTIDSVVRNMKPTNASP